MQTRPLIVRLRNWVGDVVLGVPMLQRLAGAGYSLRLVGKRWAADLLAGEGWPVTVLEPRLAGRVAQLRALRRQALAEDPGFDRRINMLVLPFSLSSAIDARGAGLKGLGYRHEGRSLLLARAVPRREGGHESLSYWELGSALLGAPAPAPDRVQLHLTPEHEAQARALRERLGLRPGYIVVCPFAGGTMAAQDKRWPEFPRWVERALPSLGRDVVLLPGNADEAAVATQCYPGCLVAPGVGLGAYAALLREAALVVSNDTGPGHMAAAVGAPLLSVLGPTDPARWGALGPTVRIARQGQAWPGLDQVDALARELLAPAAAR